MCMTMRGIKEAGKPDSDAGKTWSLRDRPGTGRTIFPHVGEIAMLMEKYIECRASMRSGIIHFIKYYRKMKKLSMTVNFVVTRLHTFWM